LTVGLFPNKIGCIVNIPFLNKKREIALDLKDKDGKRVVWYKESYEAHVKQKHFVGVNSHQDKIKKAVSSPQLKGFDKKHNNMRYYYEIRKNKNGQPLYMRVAVDYNDKPASIHTAYLTTDTRGATIVYD
jgi:hypothetical protein